MDAQKNRLNETVLLSTHNICFSWEIRKIIFQTHSYQEAGDCKKKDFLFNLKMAIFSLFLHRKVCCGYSLEASHWDSSNEYPLHMSSLRKQEI